MKFPLWIFGVLILLINSSVSAANLTYADYAELPEKSMVVVSPSGTKLAYRETAHGLDSLIVLNLNTGSIIRSIALDAVDPDNVYFIDDKRLILVASKNSKLSGFIGRYDVSVAYSFNLEDGKIHQLMTAGYGIYEGQSSLGGIVGISADHKYAYMPAWKKQSVYSLFRVNLTSRRKPIVHKKGTSDTIDYFVGNNGTLLARERYNNESNVHKLEAWKNEEWVTLFKEETEIKHVSFVGVTADRENLVMQRHNDKYGRWAYHTISLKMALFQKLFLVEKTEM